MPGVLLVLGLSGGVSGQVGFWELPTSGASASANAVNFDGTVAAGGGTQGSLRWVNRVVEVVPAPDFGLAIDAAGGVVAGAGFRWSAQTGTQVLLPIPGCNTGLATGNDVSYDGSVVIGTVTCNAPMPDIEMFRWTAQTGVVLLGFPPATSASFGYGVSGDSHVIVGTVNNLSSFPVKWTEQTGFTVLPGIGDAFNSSFTGSVVVGSARLSGQVPLAVRWVANQFQALATDGGRALAVSSDGYVIVGQTGGNQPFVWDPVHRQRLLRTLLDAHGISTADWRILRVTSISGDGTTLVGNGERFGNSNSRAWMARIPRFCYANCDDSTIGPTLNVNDFVCFLTHFASADAFYADCNLDAALNVDDFVCFLQSFAAGCP